MQVQLLGSEDALEKGMAIHSSAIAWRISWTEEPRGLQSMWSLRFGHDWETNILTLSLPLWEQHTTFLTVNLVALIATDIGRSQGDR